MVELHIEPTSKCTLDCPLCDRTWFYKTFKKRLLHEIDIYHLEKFVKSNTKIVMCGNNGDPIYHSKFHELCKKLKNNGCKIKIITNGSARSKTWWQELNKILNEDDQLTFSIDGLKDTNHLYRKNAKWESIMKAVSIFSTRKCRLEWKYIVFKHNQHQINEANELSKKLGFDNFRLESSDRWLGEKELMPDKKYVDTYYEQQKKILDYPTFQTTMNPYCIKNNAPSNQLYIDAEGNFYPCCWMGTYRYKFKSIFSPKERKFNIGNTTLDGILKNQIVKDFFKSTKQFTSAHECCKIQCGVKNG